MPSKLDLLFSNWNTGDIKIERKVPICLLLDVSGSMCNYDGSSKTKIEEINDNVKTFLEFVKNDPRASKISEICIITFGDVVKVVQDYSDIANINIPKFTAHGGTPLGGAVEKAVELLSKRRQFYRDNNIEHFKPILLLMTDGEPTDDYYASAKNFKERVSKSEFKVFPVGMGKSFNCTVLNQFTTPKFPPKQISKTEEFEKLFNLLSESSRKPEDDPLAKWWNELA